MKKEKREMKHSVFQRILAVLGCFLFLTAGIVWLVAGFQIVVAALLLAAVAGISGPAVAEGGGILDIVGSIFEAVLEGIMGIFELIGDLFNF
ncbi:hypothetical protein [Pelagicoccus mobilis]|uniref:Uncharacterized protein n=1 Tax=Pelagicoccus mobilis TaxID=415221 RepID=A0A934VPQ4_9BACT|nr:hypothetical protein [Pelagicoccus mobilis]MBK1875764.1 hypothetical protein [Pelagicoccus mobilis]